MRAGCYLFVAAIGLCAGPAFAQDAPVDKVYACADIADSTARLACYDAAVAGLRQAQSAGNVAVVSRAQIQAAEKEAFGLNQPSLSELARSATRTPAAPGPGPQELDAITLSVKALQRRPDGTYRFTMENGQVWDQIDTYDLGRTLKAPMSAVIRKAAIGSYMLKADGRTAVRVERVR